MRLCWCEDGLEDSRGNCIGWMVSMGREENALSGLEITMGRMVTELTE